MSAPALDFDLLADEAMVRITAHIAVQADKARAEIFYRYAIAVQKSDDRHDAAREKHRNSIERFYGGMRRGWFVVCASGDRQFLRHPARRWVIELSEPTTSPRPDIAWLKTLVTRRVSLTTRFYGGLQ